MSRTRDSVCTGRDACSKEAVPPNPITAANALSCRHLTFLSHCEGHVRELPAGHKWGMPEPTGGGGAWNSEKTCWLQMEFEPLAPLQGTLACCCCCGSQ